MPRCNCAGSTCGCNLIAGPGVTVTGTGTKADPFKVTATLGSLNAALSFNDSATIDFTVAGTGTPADPMTVTAITKTVPWPTYPTAGRPSAATLGAGAFFYDTTLSKPMWSNGTVWKDAAGTTVP